MAIRDVGYLKEKFNDLKIPYGSDFSDLIDSCINYTVSSVVGFHSLSAVNLLAENLTSLNLSVLNGSATIGGLISSNNTIYDKNGNSNQWNSTYTTVQSNSSLWGIGGASMDIAVRSLTANWDSTYTTVQNNSASWDYQGSDIKSLTANWDSTYTTVQNNSSTYALKSFVENNFFKLSGGTISGDTRINSNLTVYGNLSATGNSYFFNTVYSTTSALSVVNIGNTGPALYVGNNGTGDIASFYDLDQNIEVLHVGGNNGTFPNVGVKTSTPNKTLTVNGEISASGDIWTSGKILSGGVDIATIFTSTPVTTNTSNLTLNLSDASSIKRLDTSLGNITVTVPSNLSVPFNIGTQLVLANISTNIVEIVATSGVTIISKNNKFKLSSQGSVASLFKTLTNEWLIVGDLTA